MTRRLYCQQCAERNPLKEDAEDFADGWRMRKVVQPVKKPADFFAKVNDTRINLTTLVCDFCNAPIADGSMATLYTFWRGPEPLAWEKEYAVAP